MTIAHLIWMLFLLLFRFVAQVSIVQTRNARTAYGSTRSACLSPWWAFPRHWHPHQNSTTNRLHHLHNRKCRWDTCQCQVQVLRRQCITVCRRTRSLLHIIHIINSSNSRYHHTTCHYTQAHSTIDSRHHRCLSRGHLHHRSRSSTIYHHYIWLYRPHQHGSPLFLRHLHNTIKHSSNKPMTTEMRKATGKNWLSQISSTSTTVSLVL